MKKRLVLTKDTRIYHHPTCFAGNREIKYDHKGLLSLFFFFFILKLEIFSFTGV